MPSVAYPQAIDVVLQTTRLGGSSIVFVGAIAPTGAVRLVVQPAAEGSAQAYGGTVVLLALVA